jgi:hypothetical protein
MSLLLAQEQWFYVAVEQILRHISRDRRLALLQHVQISITLLRSYLVPDVEQLPHIGVERRILLIVS